MIKRVIFLGILPVLLFVGGCTAYLFYSGVIWFNNPSLEAYPVRGVDVSADQGVIDWLTLSRQENISFAFIKATEGSSDQDAQFQNNLTGAQLSNLTYGFYHLFSYDSPGNIQAENFIRTVPKIDGMLPPVVYVEFNSDQERRPVMPEIALPILDALLQRLEIYYDKRPILYATDKTFDLYLKERYYDYPLWIRNVTSAPQMPRGFQWAFWQYNHRKELEGYGGPEKYIAMNVFNGTQKDFQTFVNRKREAKQSEIDEAWDALEAQEALEAQKQSTSGGT